MAQVRQLTCAALVSAATFSVTTSTASTAQQRGKTRPAHPPQAQAKAAPPALECGDYLGFQVLLDNQGFSVGQIDGKPGANFSHALGALQPTRKLPASGEPDCATWHALGGDTAGPTAVNYTVTEDDVKGPFVKTIWDAKASDNSATLKPGPNNPVGIVWIDVNIEHYGMHGTPEPANVGHTESHGCVRLTNWDAAKLAALVKPGTPVLFR